MATENRSITKALGGAEDLLVGRVDQVTQSRNGQNYTISGIDVPLVAASTAAISALDVTKFTRARVYTTVDTYADYIYDSAATVGLASLGTGKWVLSTSSNVSTVLADYVLKTTAATAQRRCKVNYASTTSVQLEGVPEKLVMSGFRYMGNYKKARSRYIDSGSTTGTVTVSETANLAIESTIHVHNWYAIFAVANTADSTASYVLMPYFRAGTVVNSAINLAQGGEGDGDTVTLTSYTGLTTNELLNRDVLVIQENKIFSGRTATVTANTDAQVTLDTIGSVAPTDFILVSPPYDDYVYLGSYYHDAAEPRNIADTGNSVSSYGIDNVDMPAAGAMTSTRISFAGQVPPLATAIRCNLTYSLSTGSTGVVVHYFDVDSSNHTTESVYREKVGTSTETFISTVLTLYFAKEQASWITSAGSLDASVTGRTLHAYGWIEE